MKVNFFICGVQKGGTTALYSFLRAHPDVEMAKQKETHFFDDGDSISWIAPDYGALHSFFSESPAGRLRGEATPIYSYWPDAIERLYAYNPAAKLILMLRHPVLRAWSHWRMEIAKGKETIPFSEAIRPTGRERVLFAPGSVHRVFSYVERGFYAPQIERLYGLFPRHRILILRTDNLWNHPTETLQDVQSFLGIPLILEGKKEYVASIKSDDRNGSGECNGSDECNEILLDDADYLTAVYAEDVQRTQRLSGLNLQDWLDPMSSYHEPIQSQPNRRRTM